MRRLKLTEVLTTPGVTRAPIEKAIGSRKLLSGPPESVKLILRLRTDLPPDKRSIPILLTLLDQVNCLAVVERRARLRGSAKPKSSRGARRPD